MDRVVSKIKIVKGHLKKLNDQNFNDIQAADIQAMQNRSRCQNELKGDVLNLAKQQAEHDDVVEYRKFHHI